MDEKITFHKGDFLSDEQAMKFAIQEAYKGAPFVSPNPLVGCVILDENHKFLSSGYHHKFGEPHAEVDAYSKLTEYELENAQVFVTLEPCAHEGKTPSCAKALAKMGLKRVIFGLEDPNPLVAGQGAQIIRDAGISCLEYGGELKADLEDTCEVFLKNYRQKKTFVAAKVAQSLDGQIALASGESKWITSEESREFVHELRSWYDGIIVGRNTIETDNPSLDVRHPKIKKENYLIVIDPEGKILKSKKSYKFLDLHKKEKIIFAVKTDVTTDYQTLKFNDLNDLLNQLCNLKIKSVFIEGGARTYSSFLTEGLIDRLHIFTAPVIIGASEGLSWSKYFSVPQLAQKLVLKNVKHKTFSPDQYLTGRLTGA